MAKIQAMDEAYEECKSCYYWVNRDNIDGFCRRYAPRSVMEMQHPQSDEDTDGPDRGVWWPNTLADEWCGEWRRSRPVEVEP